MQGKLVDIVNFKFKLKTILKQTLQFSNSLSKNIKILINYKFKSSLCITISNTFGRVDNKTAR